MNYNFKIKFLIFGLLLLIVPLQAYALKAPEPNKSSVYNYNAYEVVTDNEGENHNLISACEKQEGRFFDKIEDCGAVCQECVLKENGCWHCLDSAPESSEEKPTQTESNNGFWQQVKNWFLNLWNNFLNIFKAQPQNKAGNDQVGQVDREEGLGKKINKFLKAEQGEADMSEEEKEEIEKDLREKVSDARSLGELFKLRELVFWWCGERYGLEGEDYENCQDYFKNLIKKKGDKFKEKELEKINEEDISAKTFKQMENLYALLAAAQTARGEGTFFSTENIIKVRGKLREKAQKFIKKALLKAKWEEIEDWLNLVLVYTRASDSQGSDLFKGNYPLGEAQYRYRRLLLQKLAGMDICNPDPNKVRALRERLGSGQGCAIKLGSEQACQELAQGNLEEAYKILYKKDKNDQANDLEENQVFEPVDCDKSKEDSNSSAKEESKEEAGTETDLEDSTEEIKNTDTDTGSGVEVDCGDGLCEFPEEENQEETAESSENVGETTSTSTPEENEENNVCHFEIIPDNITGWNFRVNDCEKDEDFVYGCILECGPLPPQKIFNREEELCYETAGGFIDYNSEVICRNDPLPPEEIEICVSDCLNR